VTGASSSGDDFAARGGWPQVLGQLVVGAEVDDRSLEDAFSEILLGRATPAQVAAFAIGMRTKGESAHELATLLGVMQRFGVGVALSEATRARAICTCGTGGDRSHSINISTTAMFVVAGAGGIVCKHGGRAASSASGSADVLEALGVKLDVSPEVVAACIEETGLGFCLAPVFHPAMRHAAPTRRELGVATLFNLLGPLANPGNVGRQMVGVADAGAQRRVAEVLAARGAQHAWVVRGDDGLDELTTTTTSRVFEVTPAGITERTVDPGDVGIDKATIEDLRGGSAAENAAHLRRVLAGTPGPHRDIVVLNAGAGLVVAGVAADLADGVRRAGAAIDDGSAERALIRLVERSNAPAPTP
jgi:anthranilate phosphoribosyltransferase